MKEKAGIVLMVWFTFNVCETEKSLMTSCISLYWVSLSKEMSEQSDKIKFLCGIMETGSRHA